MKSVSLWLTGYLAGREVCGREARTPAYLPFPQDPGARFLAETVSCISRNIDHSISSMYISIWISCNSTLPYSLKLPPTVCKFVVVYLLSQLLAPLSMQILSHYKMLPLGWWNQHLGRKGRGEKKGDGEWAQGGENDTKLSYWGQGGGPQSHTILRAVRQAPSAPFPHTSHSAGLWSKVHRCLLWTSCFTECSSLNEMPPVRFGFTLDKILPRGIYMKAFYVPTILAVREHEPGETTKV